MTVLEVIFFYQFSFDRDFHTTSSDANVLMCRHVQTPNRSCVTWVHPVEYNCEFYITARNVRDARVVLLYT